MTKNEYISELKLHLKGLPEEELNAALSYYEEFFEEAGEENYADVIIDLGNPKNLAKSIIDGQIFSGESSSEYIPMKIEPVYESSEPKTEPKKSAGNGGKTALIVVLCVIFSPLIFGLGSAVLGTAVGIACGVFGIVLAFGVAALVLAAVGIFLFGLGIAQLLTLPWEGFALMGSSLIVFAVAMIFLLLFVLMCGKLIPAMIRGTVTLFRRLFNINTPAAA